MARNEKLFWYSLLASFLLILLAGFANPAVFAQGTQNPDYVVKIKAFGFVPTFAVVSSGTTVIWVNERDDMVAVVMAGGFGNQEIGPGMNLSFRFNKPGVYEYTMQGATGILVVD